MMLRFGMSLWDPGNHDDISYISSVFINQINNQSINGENNLRIIQDENNL